MNIYDQLEAKRKESMKHCIIGGVVIGIGFLSFVFANIFAVVVILIGFLYSFLVSYKKTKEYKKFYKDHLVKAILEELLDDVHFAPEHGIDEEVIRRTEMMMLGNRYYSNDYISASYHGTPFVQSDVLIQDVRHSGKHTTTVTYFKGRWFIFKFNKKFKYDMQIKEKSFNYSKLKGSLFGPKEEKFKKIAFEDEVFNSVFTTHARNEHEAFYIVTPHFMQNVMDFNNAVSGDILMCFVDNELHLALHNNDDAFEPGIFSKTDPQKERSEIIRDIEVITKFVDELKLDDHLFD